MHRFLSTLVVLLLVSFFTAGNSARAQVTTLTPPAISGYGGTQIPQPTQIIGYDSSTGLPCIAGYTPTCQQSVTQQGTDRAVSIPAVSTSAYASGNDIGGLNVLSFQGSGPVALVEDVSVKSLSGQTPTLTVYLFDSQPQHSTFTDRSTFSLDTTTPGSDGIIDIDRLVIPPFALTLAAGTGSAVSFADNANLARLPKSGASALYYALVSGSTFTPGSTTDLHVGVQVVQQHQ